jgi:hypothetical protein
MSAKGSRANIGGWPTPTAAFVYPSRCHDAYITIPLSNLEFKNLHTAAKAAHVFIILN